MIVGLRGTLEAIGPDWVYVQVGGVTLQVFMPASAIAALGPVGGATRLFTHLRMRDEQPVLYGFPSQLALDLFLLVQSVSGIGPRLALAMLSALGGEGLQRALASGDVAALSSVSGVGRRIASRLALELKGKLDFEGEDAPPLANSMDADVIAALAALGYTPAEARRAVASLGAEAAALPLEERIRLALQSFGAGQ